MFLIDKSGSMEGAIEQSKEALSRILAGFAAGQGAHRHLRHHGDGAQAQGAPRRAAVQHMLGGSPPSGGTVHGAAVRALHQAGVRVPAAAKLVVIVAGDEAGEEGGLLADTFRELRLPGGRAGADLCRGRAAAAPRCAPAPSALGVSFTEVDVEQFDDPYQVPRVLQALLEAPVPTGFPGATVPRISWVDKVMQTPLLRPDGRPEARP